MDSQTNSAIDELIDTERIKITLLQLLKKGSFIGSTAVIAMLFWGYLMEDLALFPALKRSIGMIAIIMAEAMHYYLSEQGVALLLELINDFFECFERVIFY